MMNNEDFEQKMNFIVNQQAQFAVDIEKLYAAQRQTEQKLSETTEVVNRLAYVTNFGFKDVNAKIDALVDSQIRTDEMIKELTASQKKTNEKFRKLIDRLDRRSSNGGNTS